MATRKDSDTGKTEERESNEERTKRLHTDMSAIRRDAVKTYDKVRDAARAAWIAVFDGTSPVDDPNVGRHLAKDHQQRLKKRRVRDQLKAVEAEVALNAAAPRAQFFHERTIGTDDFLRLDYFVQGLVAARSVGRIDALFGLYQGTGFICAPGFIMTNHHVISSKRDAEGTEIGFEKYNGRSITPEISNCRLDPERFFWTSKRDDLDVTIVALDPRDDGEEISYELGWHRLLEQQGKIVLGDPTSIIQYPRGHDKRTVVHNSSLVYLEDQERGSTADRELDRYLWYTSDTEPGSSGSPVFNKHWEVVAVHHAAIPKTNEDGEYVDEQGRTLSEEDIETDPSLAIWVANQGVRASRIVKALEKANFTREERAAEFDQHRNFILNCWRATDGQSDVRMRTLRRIAQVQALERGEGRLPRVSGTDTEFAESASLGLDLDEDIRRQMRLGGITINIGR